jgi:hypothetical protein
VSERFSDVSGYTEGIKFEALGYSVISPIMNGLACATFFAFYMLYKYLFLWSFTQTTADTGGLFFPKAIQHVFVGLYINQVRVFRVCICTLELIGDRDGVGVPVRAVLALAQYDHEKANRDPRGDRHLRPDHIHRMCY